MLSFPGEGGDEMEGRLRLQDFHLHCSPAAQCYHVCGEQVGLSSPDSVANRFHCSVQLSSVWFLLTLESLFVVLTLESQFMALALESQCMALTLESQFMVLTLDSQFMALALESQCMVLTLESQFMALTLESQFMALHFIPEVFPLLTQVTGILLHHHPLDYTPINLLI